MPKKKKNAPPVTDTETEPEPEEVAVDVATTGDLIKPEPAQPKPEPPLTIEAVAANQVQMEKELQEWANELTNRLAPMIQLSDQLAAQQQAQQGQQPQEGQPQQAPPGIGGLGQILQLLPALIGGGSGDSELAQLGNTYGKLVLKNAIENINKPSIQEQIGNSVLESFINKRAKEVAKNLE